MICAREWITNNQSAKPDVKTHIPLQLVNIIHEFAKNTTIPLDPENFDFLIKLNASLAPLRDFCKKYKVKLTGVNYTTESGDFEPCFYFSNNDGYYTINGILKSI